MGAIVSGVESGSIAARYGFLEKDEIITINRQLVQDIIDYFFLTAEHKLEINYLRNGFPHTTVIHKNMGESLGLDFENELFNDIKQCPYKCIFCFVRQMPKGLRKTLYIRDDDYRLSFLHGSYITLTSLSEKDLRRITAMRLSPLYVSVHATDPKVRAEMMSSPSAGNILKMLRKLKEHDIQCHTQIVLVPGYNDGKVLKKSLEDLLSLTPTVKSVAIVPVGLTKHRKNQPKLRPFRKKDAKQVYDLVTKYQNKALKKLGYPLFYMADEIYLLLETDFPKYAHYGNFAQIGNGIGTCRKFITEFNRRKRFIPKRLEDKRNVWVLSGGLGEKVLKPIIKDFEKVSNLSLFLIPVENKFFGTSVTVTGLLTGTDIKRVIKANLKQKEKPDYIVISDIMLREGCFLDDVTPENIERELGVKVKVASNDAKGFIEVITGVPFKNTKKAKEKEIKNISSKANEVVEVVVPFKSDFADQENYEELEDKISKGKVIKIESDYKRTKKYFPRKKFGRKPTGNINNSRKLSAKDDNKKNFKVKKKKSWDKEEFKNSKGKNRSNSKKNVRKKNNKGKFYKTKNSGVKSIKSPARA